MIEPFWGRYWNPFMDRSVPRIEDCKHCCMGSCRCIGTGEHSQVLSDISTTSRNYAQLSDDEITSNCEVTGVTADHSCRRHVVF